MPREPLRLTADTLARYRCGAPVAVALGALAGIPPKRPRPYLAHELGIEARAANAGALVEDRRFAEANQRRAAGEPITAVIPIRGALTQYATISDCGEPCSYEVIEADAIDAAADPGVGQGVLDIDSPGGDVPGLEDACVRIAAAWAAAGKPLLAFSPGMCCSAAYWLATTCAGIYLSPSAIMGAVGACVVFGTDARRLEREGTDIHVGRYPVGKYNPNDVEVLDDLGKGRIDARAKDAAMRFVAAVASVRKLPTATVEGWNGASFTGEQAVAAGLADGVGRLEQIIALAEAWPRAEAA